MVIYGHRQGGPTPKKSRNYLFLGKIFKFQGRGGGPDPRSPPPLDPRMLQQNRSKHFVFRSPNVVAEQWEYTRGDEKVVYKKVEVISTFQTQ